MIKILLRPGREWVRPAVRLRGQKSDLDHIDLLPPRCLLLRTTQPLTAAGDSSGAERNVPLSPRKGNATTGATDEIEDEE